MESTGTGYKVPGSGPDSYRDRFWALGYGFWVLGSRFWVLGSGFWVKCITIHMKTILKSPGQFHLKMEAPTISAELYEAAFPSIAAWVGKMNGSLEDAKDLFHDALVLYQEKLNEGVVITTSPEAYLMGIVKHLWARKFRNRTAWVSFDALEMTISVPENFYPTINDMKLLQFLERAGKNCLELLRNFYYERLTTAELAGKMGYRSEHSATVQKYKCIEKLRNTIKQKSLNYEDFVD